MAMNNIFAPPYINRIKLSLIFSNLLIDLHYEGPTLHPHNVIRV